MSARFVLVCDVCGAITDDHYPYPVARARRLARALGFHYRRMATRPGDYRGSNASYKRMYVDLCPEHIYAFEFGNREPLQHSSDRYRKHGPDPQPMQPLAPEPHKRFAEVTVTYQEGDGPYRLYTELVGKLREHGITRPQLERLRREMFAPEASFVEVADRWAIIETERTDS